MTVHLADREADAEASLVSRRRELRRPHRLERLSLQDLASRTRAAAREERAHEAAEVQDRGVHGAARVHAEAELGGLEDAAVLGPHVGLGQVLHQLRLLLERAVRHAQRDEDRLLQIGGEGLLLRDLEHVAHRGDAGVAVLDLLQGRIDEGGVVQAADRVGEGRLVGDEIVADGRLADEPRPVRRQHPQRDGLGAREGVLRSEVGAGWLA